MRVTRCVEHNAPMVPRRCGALRSPSPPMKSLPSLAALSLLAACSASARTVPVVVQPSLPARTVRGTVRYEARRPTPTGASREGELRPARFVTLTALDVGDHPVGECIADAQGAFTCEVAGSAKTLAISARLRTQGLETSCSPDQDLRRIHEMRVALSTGDAPLEVVARDSDPQGFSGALHIVDTVMRGLEAVKTWTGETLPPLIVYWGRGVTTEWSYYRGERPAHSGRFMLELLGGERGRQSSTDTDEHDEGIILHEVGHFVMDRLSTNSSPGGTHPSNTLIDPGLAWEEGRATWFSSAVRHDSHYRDTIGIEPSGSLRVDHDLERSEGPRGNGAENSVSDVLWDLTDGYEGYDDGDHDGVGLNPASVLRAMVDMNRVPGAFPCLSSFLTFITAPQTVGDRGTREPLLTTAALATMLSATHEPGALAHPTDDRWPVDLALPSSVTDKVDGLTNPAPSGGPRRPENGLDALRVYRVQITARAWLNLELRIQGSGSPNDHTDLDLELRDIRGEVLAAARGTAQRETLSRLLQPGYYIVYVRDGGNGNRARFDLSARIRPV